MKRLYRKRNDKMLAGVCAGLADYLDIDPTIVRIIFLILVFAGLGGVLVYAILWVITPLEPSASEDTIDARSKGE
ncbi:MAG TPA: PspC domain-containing protein [Anaerolineaceae bacterium]|jgi:phage shock protein C|nr:PspC domain-containing protein [Anaerolineaceae bacterium]